MTTAVERRQTAAEIREEERRKRSNTDRLLLTYARLSLEEIEEKTGVPAAEAGLRLNELLRARDHLSERQEERLLIIELGDLIDDVKNRMGGANDENYADIANVALRGYEAIAKRFDARRKLTEADMAEITRAQGEMFLAVLIEAISLAGNYMEELHPDLDFDIRDDLEAAFDYAIPLARSEVNKNIRE
jgi:hypothetical protein